MRKGENIYKRKDGRWEGRYVKGRKADGKIKYGYIYGKTYQEVRNKLYPLKMKFQIIIEEKGDSGLSVCEWVKCWLFDLQKELKPSTYASYSYKMTRYILPSIGDIPLNQLESSDVEKLFLSLKERLSLSSLHVIYQIGKKCFKDALKSQLISTNPFEDMHISKNQKVRIHSLSKYEQKKLEKVAEEDPQKGFPVLLSLYTGMRIGEIAALKWEDIDLKEEIITVKHTYQRIPLASENKMTTLVYGTPKTESSIRKIPINKKIKHYLIILKKEATSPFIFSTKGAPLEPRVLTYYFHVIRKKAGLSHVHFHQLRHTFATRCLENNADISSLSSLLGHHSTQMTLDVYTDTLLEQRRKIIKKLGR